MKKLIVKKLRACCETPYIDRNVLLGNREGELHQVEYESLNVLEYENGLIRVTDLWTSDRYFESRESLLFWKPYKQRKMTVVSVEETDMTFTYSAARLLDSIARSIADFGADSVPEKHKDLLAPLLQDISDLRSELDRLDAKSIIVVPDEEAAEDVRIEEIGSTRYCYSDCIDIELTLANWRQMPDSAGAKAAWKHFVDSGRPVLKGLD